MKNVPSISGYLKQGRHYSNLSLSLSLPFKDDHLVVAENTGNLVHLVSCIAGEYEAPRLVVPNTAFIFHLNKFGFKNVSTFFV